MSYKTLVWIFVSVGSIIGGWIPTLWHANIFSLWSIILSSVGGIVGVWAAYRLTH